jgi:hypothetical protein
MATIWESEKLISIPAPQIIVVERALETMWDQRVVEVFQVAKPSILLATHATRSGFLVIMR